jgi:hypothetical protein
MVIRATAGVRPSRRKQRPGLGQWQITRISDIRSTDRGAMRVYNPLTWEPVSGFEPLARDHLLAS